MKFNIQCERRFPGEKWQSHFFQVFAVSRVAASKQAYDTVLKSGYNVRNIEATLEY